MQNNLKFLPNVLILLALLLSPLTASATGLYDQPVPPVTPSENWNPLPPMGLPTQSLTPLSSDFYPTQPTAPLVSPRITPERFTHEMNPGESEPGQLSIFTGDIPFGKGDILFVFDRTGSMWDEIAQAKVSAIDIMNAIRSRLPNAWFGVGSFMDYPGYFSYPGYADSYGDSSSGDVAWELNIDPTDYITDVATTINNLWMGYGMDWPEDYTRALYEISQVETAGWRNNAKKIVILFGDAPTHDLDFAGYNFGGDPGIDSIAQTDDDLNFETVVQQVADADISVIAVDSGYSPESEATFKGMSIGYAGVPGTNGHYYNLNDVTQIPTVTVQTIISETQIIDHLSLLITPGYENWVSYSPSEFTDVSSNITVTFELEFTVPENTDPGFYPFTIQVMGDGARIGLTYVEITVPVENPVDDIGFRPNPDGFRFKNESSTLTWDMFEQFFGSEMVEYSNGDRIHTADIFFREFYQSAGSGGSCDGFSATSLLNYENLSQPNAGDFAMSHYSPLFPETQNDDMRDAYAFSQGIQTGVEVNYYEFLACNLIGYSPHAHYDYLKSLLEQGSPAVVRITAGQDFCIDPPFQDRYCLEEGSGHALVAYRFEEPSEDQAFIYVYDSNLPGNDDHRIEFDFNEDKWFYDWPIPLWFDMRIEGDASNCLLKVTPLEMYRHPGIPWWNLEGWTSAVLFATSGDANLLFTDDEGNRLGFDDEGLHEEISGASYFPISNGTGVADKGFYYVPNGLEYDLQVNGKQEGIGSVHAWSQDYLVELTNLEVVTGTLLELVIPEKGGEITISNVVTPTQGTLSISQMLASDERTASVNNLSLNPGDQLTLQTVVSDTLGFTDTIKLISNSPISTTYDLSLQRAGGEGYSVFGHSSLVLDPLSSSTLKLSDWSQMDVMSIEIDLYQDGYIDNIMTATNQSAPSSIHFEPSRTSVYIGGNVLKIFLGVRDQFGSFAPNSTPVTLSTNLGSLSLSEGFTSGGLLEFSLTSGNQTGTATITATSGEKQASIDIAFISHQIFLPSVNR